MIRLKFSALGLILIVSLGVVLALGHYFLISPALVPRADGTYGEIYGPVSALKGPFYFLLLCAAVLVFYFCFVRKRSENEPAK
jgi:hypothetical protein